MCGITGFITHDREASVEAREDLLDRMCRSIEYRGPDEQGTLVRGRAALGMRRLSIIDIRTGQQPIFNEDESRAIVFNGEIYNFQELRPELEAAGHKFKTNSDTEVILHAFEEFGEECVKRLRGMFAFAIWDFRDQSLFLARDRAGKKPLFYTRTPQGDFVFGSELKTLLVHGQTPREVDLSALDAYLTFGYVPEEFCILNGVEKMQPGHWLKFADGSITTKQYWDFELGNPDPGPDENEWAEMVRAKITDAVRARLISEVPLGAFLSGGIDSSTVVGVMSELSDRPVKTFSIGFEEDSFDELKFARLASKRFGTDHHEFIVTPDLFDVLDKIVKHFDEPFADQSSLPTFMLSKMAREHVTVVLSGDGGDELFGGYSRYLIERSRDRFSAIPRAIRSGLMRPIGRILPHGTIGKNFIYNISLDPVERYLDSVSSFNQARRSQLYTGDLKVAMNGSGSAAASIFEELSKKGPQGDPLARLLYLDCKTYLPGDILTKVDRMTMASSLEARVPLLDHELIDLVTRIPSDLKLKGSDPKYILKKAMKGLVPDEILYREKQGFGVPVGEWINRQLRSRIDEDLSNRRTIERGYFDPAYLKILRKEHADGRRDHSNSLWVLWMLELWFRAYIDA
ncbi:MAG: asparagine synthase (glutamine-hydrolyzing) [Pyrinomonadaceae bacterium]